MWDQKGARISFDVGGAAGKTDLFCYLCNLHSSERATIFKIENGKKIPVSPSEIMREITENPEKTLDSILSQYQAIQSEMNRKPGPNTLPGITIKDSAPCTLHAVNQCASQICTKTAKRFNGINNPKIREEKKKRFEEYMRNYVFGSIQRPSRYEIHWNEPKGTQIKLKGHEVTRFFKNSENFIDLWEGIERRIWEEFFQNFPKLCAIWDTGGYCSKIHDHGQSKGFRWKLSSFDSSPSLPSSSPPQSAAPPSSLRSSPSSSSAPAPFSQESALSSCPSADFFHAIPLNSCLLEEDIFQTEAQPQPQPHDCDEDEENGDDVEDLDCCLLSFDVPPYVWNEFQKHANISVIILILMFGAAGVWNYAHMLGAGHFRDFGMIHGNLAIFNQQAIENVQGVHATFSGHCSQRNGRIGKNKTKTSIEEDLIRLSLRKLGVLLLHNVESQEKPSIFTKNVWEQQQKKRKSN